MLKKILLASIFAIIATTTIIRADDDTEIPASKAYVDTAAATRQDKIPAAGGQNVPEGETVMTYTTTGNGVIGERGIYSDASIYNANTDADKLITASAMTDTFNSIPTTNTTKLVCADSPACTLWTIVDQTAYGLDPTYLGYILNNSVGETTTVRPYGGGDRCLIFRVSPNTTYTVTRGIVPNSKYDRIRVCLTTKYPKTLSDPETISNTPCYLALNRTGIAADVTTGTFTTNADTVYAVINVRNSGAFQGTEWDDFVNAFRITVDSEP